MNKFHNIDGSPTAYAFACGYTQNFYEGSWHVQLYKEHMCYSVRSWENSERRNWDVFDTLTPARQRYRELVREIKRQ